MILRSLQAILSSLNLRFSHPDDEDRSTLKYAKTVHHLSADSTPKETLLWLRDLQSVINNQCISMADGKIATLSHIASEELWPVVEANFAAEDATEDLKSKGYTAAVNALITKIFLAKVLNKQKSYMNRHLRKPVDMKVRPYMEHGCTATRSTRTKRSFLHFTTINHSPMMRTWSRLHTVVYLEPGKTSC